MLRICLLPGVTPGCSLFFFFQAEDGIRDHCVTGVQTCALPISFNPDRLAEIGEVRKLGDGLKVLGSGELKRAIHVTAHLFSKSALEKIKAAGGTARSEEHTSELQSHSDLVCRLLLGTKK